MSEFFEGILKFFEILVFMFITLEVVGFVEEKIQTKLNFRVVGPGLNTSLVRIVYRQLLVLLRRQYSPRQALVGSLKLSSVFLTLSLLPGPSGKAVLDLPHSLWVFFLFCQLMPILVFVASLWMNKGRAWPGVLSQVERAQGALASVLILGITIMGVTGYDRITDLLRLQNASGWLVAQNLIHLPLLLCFLCLVAFLSAQNLFSRDVFKALNEAIIPIKLESMLIRFVWGLFVANVFLGGADPLTGGVGLFIKMIVIGVVLEVCSSGFIRIREDQAEQFILWRFTPLCLVIFILTLIVQGVTHA